MRSIIIFLFTCSTIYAEELCIKEAKRRDVQHYLKCAHALLKLSDYCKQHSSTEEGFYDCMFSLIDRNLSEEEINQLTKSEATLPQS